MDDVKSWLSQPCTGTVETAAAPFWRLVMDVKTVVVRRPVEEVVDSVLRLGFQIDRGIFTRHIQQLDRKLDQIERRVPGVLSVTFDDLRTEETCKRVFEHCLGYPFDREWFELMAPINMQINMWHMTRYFAAHQPQLEKLAKIAKHTILQSISRDLVEVDHDDGLTIQQEPLMTALADAIKYLAPQHCVAVGEAPDSYQAKNWPLMQTLEDLGALQVTTARCNGRLFGYLVTVISPSLESPDLKTATNTTFAASPEFKGLGMKLQRASLAALRERGVDEVYYHAGTRGSGPRMGVLYRRLGAEPFGDWYKLTLGK